MMNDKKTLTEQEIIQQLQGNTQSINPQAHTSPINPNALQPLPDIASIKTEEQAEQYFVQEMRRRYRLDKYYNMVDNLDDMEILDAIYDALQEINEYQPITNYTLLHLLPKTQRYRRTLLYGAGAFAILTLMSEWSANGMSVAIEDLSFDNKLSELSEYQQKLYEQFTDSLERLKQRDRWAVSQSRFSTGKFPYMSGTARGQFSFRVNSILRRGGNFGL